MMPKFAPVKDELEENDYCFVNISTEEVYMSFCLETRSRSNVSGTYESERHKCENSHFSCQFWPYSLVITLDDSEDVCDPKWYLKCPRNFQLPPWLLPRSVSCVQCCTK